MRKSDDLFSGEENKGIWALGSLTAGAIVVGVVLMFAGPFVTVLAIVSSIVYGTGFMLSLLTPKEGRKKLWE
ncbi:MAG: hypothetical protein J4F46_00370 [Dehalococcoidia bacterium]|nr:hypothetical protein [Dehalococcoidia bacterium]